MKIEQKLEKYRKVLMMLNNLGEQTLEHIELLKEEELKHIAITLTDLHFLIYRAKETNEKT